MPVSWSTAFKLKVGAWLSGMASLHGRAWLRHLCSHFLQDAFRRQLRREQDYRHAGARVGGCSYKVQVPVLGVPVVRSEVAHLGEVVAQAERRALFKIEVLLPRAGLVDNLELDMSLKVLDVHVLAEPLKDCLSCAPHHAFPILCVLSI